LAVNAGKWISEKMTRTTPRTIQTTEELMFQERPRQGCGDQKVELLNSCTNKSLPHVVLRVIQAVEDLQPWLTPTEISWLKLESTQGARQDGVKSEWV
jgi:hypothetical protein